MVISIGNFPESLVHELFGREGGLLQLAVGVEGGGLDARKSSLRLKAGVSHETNVLE